MNKNLKIARDYLKRTAPLGKMDCGKICGKKCCQGDSETGMWLFPFEEEFYINNPNFTVKQTQGNHGYKMVVCNGTCNREDRPLSCRIFPFYPKIDDERVTVIKDLRGFSTCPILNKNLNPDLKFLRNLRMATRYLMRDKEIKEYILTIQKEIEEAAQLLYLLGVNNDRNY